MARMFLKRNLVMVVPANNFLPSLALNRSGLLGARWRRRRGQEEVLHIFSAFSPPLPFSFDDLPTSWRTESRRQEIRHEIFEKLVDRKQAEI